jgi:hypothetical protein
MATEHPPAECWSCGYVVNMATSVSNQEEYPAAGDVSVCLACGTPGVYADGPDGLTLSKPTLESELAIYQDETVRLTRNTVLRLKRERADWPKGPKEKV